MPSKNAISRKTILFVVFPQVKLLDIAGPLQVFSDANEQLNDVYKVVVASAGGGLVASDTVLPIATVGLEELKDLALDTLIISGGSGALAASRDAEFVECIEKLAQRSC